MHYIWFCTKKLSKEVGYYSSSGSPVSFGAFRTSPVQSLYSEAQEPSLYDRRKKLSLQYVTKLASNPNNPVYNDIFTMTFLIHQTKYCFKINLTLLNHLVYELNLFSTNQILM